MDDDVVVPPPPTLGAPGRSVWRDRATPVLLVLGALGLLCSVLLAIGALLAAIGAAGDGGITGALFGVCDVLVGPLDGIVQFSGSDAQSRADLVARGLASMVYLVIGLVLPSLARRTEV